MDEKQDNTYFLERLVHDLREPLRSIHSYSDLLGEASPGLDPGSIRAEIVSGAQRIRTLVDALSAYTLALRPSEGEASLHLACNMALMTLDRQVQETGAVFSDAAISGEDAPRIAVSIERLTQLMENLFANSLRFRGDLPPDVRVSAAKHESGQWLIGVEDNGIGLAPGECEAVFRPFLRLHGRKYPGAGLGLTAAKWIVENHGGVIWMESKPEGGCICRFTLPAAD